MISSSLSSYDAVSNFDSDTILKKVPVRSNSIESMFDTATAGFDYTSVSKRTSSSLDFKLVDSHPVVIDLRNYRWSVS